MLVRYLPVGKNQLIVKSVDLILLTHAVHTNVPIGFDVFCQFQVGVASEYVHVYVVKQYTVNTMQYSGLWFYPVDSSVLHLKYELSIWKISTSHVYGADDTPYWHPRTTPLNHEFQMAVTPVQEEKY